MSKDEFNTLLSGVLVLTAITVFFAMQAYNIATLPAIAYALFFAVIILVLNVAAKKIMAVLLDANVEHEIWRVERYGFAPTAYFKQPVLAGIILPLLVAVLSLGKVPLMTLFTYETRARKERAARRHGYYSYSEMTEWHNSVIGAVGIIAVLALAVIAYLLDQEPLAKLAAYYAFFNMIPISKLDGAQIFFGSRVLWVVLATLSVLFTAAALII